MSKNNKEPLKGQYQEIVYAVGHATTMWAELENGLAHLLNILISTEPNRRNFAMASAIFFAPTSLEARISIASSAFGVWADQTSKFSELRQAWKRVMRRINNNKGTRNTIAHGQIVQIHRNQKVKYRVTPPVLDPRFHNLVSTGKPIGLGAHEIQQSAKAVSEIIKIIKTLSNLADLWQRGEQQAFERTYLELLDQVPPGPSDHRKDNQNQPKD